MSVGMVLGKFMPPHRGHQMLIDFASNYVDRLYVVVGTLKKESIPGDLRYQWIKNEFPHCKVLHLTDENPQLPHEHPKFWNIWRQSLNQILPEPVDYVFAGEDYGARLAQEMTAKFLPLTRLEWPISATMIRDNLTNNWDLILPAARPYFQKKIVIFGPESTGKSTLAKFLAKHFRINHVPEFARAYLEENNGDFTFQDLDIIAKGQVALEQAVSKQAGRLLICDTDVQLTQIWSRYCFNQSSVVVDSLAQESTADLYFLTDVDQPWVPDPVRYFPEKRQEFFEICEAELKRKKAKYVRLSGRWDERNAKALKVLNSLLLVNKAIDY